MNIEKERVPIEKKPWLTPELVVLDVASDTQGGYVTTGADLGPYS
jgi:hypothetical protein